jgi:transposase InsO family protein
VKLHRNAKTTPHMRALLVERIVRQHWRPELAARAAGVSRRTAYKWLRRHREGGVGALQDRSSRPHRQPRRTSAAQVAAILTARYQRQTAWAIAVQLQIPRSTVAVILGRAGLNRLDRLTAPVPVVRYEYDRPGALLHLDIKPLARIVRVGHRIHGDRRQSAHGKGYEYAHVAVDDHSRVAYVEVLADQRGRTAAGFLRRALAWCAARGVRVVRVLTDNGSAYRADVFRAVATTRRVRLLRTRPYRPQTNGKAERFIQTLLREWAYAVPYISSARRTRALRPWLRFYNTARPHTAVGYQPPCARFPRAAQ